MYLLLLLLSIDVKMQMAYCVLDFFYRLLSSWSAAFFSSKLINHIMQLIWYVTHDLFSAVCATWVSDFATGFSHFASLLNCFMQRNKDKKRTTCLKWSRIRKTNDELRYLNDTNNRKHWLRQNENKSWVTYQIYCSIWSISLKSFQKYDYARVGARIDLFFPHVVIFRKYSWVRSRLTPLVLSCILWICCARSRLSSMKP